MKSPAPTPRSLLLSKIAAVIVDASDRKLQHLRKLQEVIGRVVTDEESEANIAYFEAKINEVIAGKDLVLPTHLGQAFDVRSPVNLTDNPPPTPPTATRIGGVRIPQRSGSGGNLARW